MLFTVNKSPLMFGSLKSALRIAREGDPILLYEDGVYAAARKGAGAALLAEVLGDHPVYALKADLDARGIVDVAEGVVVVDYDGFVELVERDHVVPWL